MKRKNKLTPQVRQAFYRQAAAQLKNGRSLIEILDDFSQRLRRKGSLRSADAINLVLRAVRDGKSLAVALGANLTYTEKAIIKAGEESSQLVMALSLITEVQERRARISRAVTSAITSPVVNFAALWICLWVIGSQLNPLFVEVVPLSRWTGWAYVMYLLGELASGWESVALVGILAIAMVSMTFLRDKWIGRSRTFADRFIFPMPIFKEVDGLLWMMAFSAMLNAKISDTNALQLQISSASPYIQERLRPVLARLRNGMALPDALRHAGHGFPSVDLIDEIGAYAGFPDFSEKLEEVGRSYMETMERKLIMQSGVISFCFTILQFLVMGAVQLGANDLQAVMMSTLGR